MIFPEISSCLFFVRVQIVSIFFVAAECRRTLAGNVEYLRRQGIHCSSSPEQMLIENILLKNKS